MIFSRKVVGWAMADHLRTELVLDAVGMALFARQPERGQLIHHSDSEYSVAGCSWGFLTRTAMDAQGCTVPGRSRAS
jgi:hypothetical protein